MFTGHSEYRGPLERKSNKGIERKERERKREREKEREREGEREKEEF